jgi:hypothetical protein
LRVYEKNSSAPREVTQWQLIATRLAVFFAAAGLVPETDLPQVSYSERACGRSRTSRRAAGVCAVFRLVVVLLHSGFSVGPPNEEYLKCAPISGGNRR